MAHLETCPECSGIFRGELPPEHRGELVFGKLMHRLRLFTAMLLMFGILFGISLTAGSGLFYNVVLMPVIGAVGYYLFRWKAVYRLPVLLTVTHFLCNLAGMGEEYLDVHSLLLWSFLYSLFVLLGVMIAALLHYVFRKED